MSAPPGKKQPSGRTRKSPAPAQHEKTAPAAVLRGQTRKLLGKHYRAKYGVR